MEYQLDHIVCKCDNRIKKRNGKRFAWKWIVPFEWYANVTAQDRTIHKVLETKKPFIYNLKRVWNVLP